MQKKKVTEQEKRAAEAQAGLSEKSALTLKEIFEDIERIRKRVKKRKGLKVKDLIEYGRR